MIRSIPLIALLLAMTQLSAADFSGRWAGTIEMNTGRFPFYVTLTFNDAKVNGFVSTGVQARPIRVENCVLGDNDLSFDIHDDANRLVHFRLTLSAGVLGGEATAGGETWKVAVVSVGGSGGDRAPTPVILPGGGSGSSSGGGSGPYRIGGGVSAPVLIHRVEPEYTEEARAAKYQGTVLLYVEIAPDGTPTNIRIQRGLGLGLDQKAIEALRQWKFKPGEKDGKPVTVAATIEVNFRL